MQDNQRQTHLMYAYAAGIMDADGCFMITSHKRKTKNGTTSRAKKFPKNKNEWSITYSPCVKISMIEPEAIDFILKELNAGHVYLSGARKDRPNSKPIYQWYLRRAGELDSFLKGIIPFLKVKKNRALFLLDYCNHRNNFKSPCYRGLSEEELAFREESYWKMRELNGSKVAATTKSHGLERASYSLIS